MKLSKINLALLVILMTSISGFAQFPSSGEKPDLKAMNIGHFYGKIVDGEGNGVPYATVALYGMVFDTINKTMSEGLIDGQITEDNGDFSMVNLPIIGEFTLKTSYIGYEEIQQKVSFGIVPSEMKMPEGGFKMPPGGMPSPGGMPAGGFKMPSGSNFDVDLGNISIAESSEILDEVVVTGKKTNVVIALDKKIYRVDQDANARGGTAVDALKNVPSLSVDINGNLSLRNGSPQLFIDGRPTNLTLNQIASDAIENVEVITNPSAKYDASGGQSGIVNIVLKKNHKIGYNGMVMSGIDSQKGYNLGGNLNLREGKVNLFLNGFANGRRGDMFSETSRNNFFNNTMIEQNGVGAMNSDFGNIRGGIDYFYNNRNTITFQGSYMKGLFGGPETLDVRTSQLNSSLLNQYTRITDSERIFGNIGASILYKHLYPKNGRELTADVNYNSVSFDNDGLFTTTSANTLQNSQQRQVGDGGTNIYTFQADYVDPLTTSLKLEAGVRATVRSVDNNNYNSFRSNPSEDWIQNSTATDQYSFEDNVFAGYATLSQELNKWSYQIGLRAESSFYKGTLADGQSFSNKYPISLFPSIFVTRKINEEDNLQFSVSRRVNRPNFFQLIPFTDYSDSLNLRRGNPDLIPEFTNSIELSYQNILNDNHNILATLYYKRANDLITTYQITEENPDSGLKNVISTFANSNSSRAYGLEATMRNQLGKKIDISTNFNFYNSKVDASNVESDLVNDQFTWFVKENININLPSKIGLQLSGQYQSKTAYSPSTGGRFGGMGFSNNSAQGYATPLWFVDAALSKPVLKNKATLSLSIQDIFRSRRMGSYSESPLFSQDTKRWTNFQVVKVNFSYRFGKTDTSLFRRKNTNVSSAGSDMMGS